MEAQAYRVGSFETATESTTNIRMTAGLMRKSRPRRGIKYERAADSHPAQVCIIYGTRTDARTRTFTEFAYVSVGQSLHFKISRWAITPVRQYPIFGHSGQEAHYF